MRAFVPVIAAIALLHATQTPAAAIQHLSRTTAPFGYVSQASTSPVQAVLVTNTGDVSLTISALTLEGAQPGDFGIAASGTCAPPIALGPSERCRIDLVMTPVSARGRAVSASVFVHTTATEGNAEITLTGTVDPGFSGPIFDVTPSWLDFGAQAVATPSAPQTLTITNRTSATFTIGQFALAGGNAGDFALTSTCAPGQMFLHNDTCAATVTFMPTAAGPRSTELAMQMTTFGIDGFFRYSITGAGGAPPPVTVVEYYNASLDHYFITWIAAEQANLDAGNTPTRWVRTGYSFNVYTTAQAGASNVCRYYIPPGLGDSHFFGRGSVECNATGAAHPTFVLEDPNFMYVFLPAAGVCPAGTTPIYRVFSNRPDANHRYMTDRAVRDLMVTRGWLAEGDGPDLVVMCAV